jgi:hypothetical protein
MSKKDQVQINPQEATRLLNNFYIQNGLNADYNRLVLDSQLLNYFLEHTGDVKKKAKVAFCSVVLNPPYWEYTKDLIDGARQFFLPGHDVDFFIWSDIPKEKSDMEKLRDKFKAQDPNWDDKLFMEQLTTLSELVHTSTTVTETEGVSWPYPTLMRYHLYLQQEEKLKEYDYVFHCDVDMKFVNVVGDEILGNGLTAAQHPMYALRKEYWPPYEPNEKSEAFIKRPGKVINDNGKPRFMPLYYAGGFQGGKSADWIKAMRTMKKMIDTDMTNNYIPIWNEESIWNKYLSENTPDVVLTPSYIYPDSLIAEYYEKIWGCSYQPRLVTLTKKFTTSAEGGQAVQEMLKNI